MVFALCDEEDFQGLPQSAVQLREERRDEETGNWKSEMGEMEGRGRGAGKESDKHSVRRLKAGMHREEEVG